MAERESNQMLILLAPLKSLFILPGSKNSHAAGIRVPQAEIRYQPARLSRSRTKKVV
jgi:hypothetical protein